MTTVRRALCRGLLLGLLAATVGCRPSGPQKILRLGDLLKTKVGQAVALPAGRVTPDTRYGIPVSFAAAEVTRLHFRAKGTSSLVTLRWRIEGDSQLPRFRKINFPLQADGREQAYEVNLGSEPYWTGQICFLLFSVGEGELEITELRGEAPADPYRTLSLNGETRPSLPALPRLAFDLPRGLPRGTVFETEVGLIPELHRQGTRVRLTVTCAGEGKERDLLTRTLDGEDPQALRWVPLRVELPAGSRHLWLSMAGTQLGKPLPEGAAMWGDPLLVSAGKPAGKNLIVILIDTLRTDRVGAYGSPKGLTPGLDAFAQGSVRFAQLHSPASWTLPSVATLVTGLQPQTHGAGQRFGEFAPTGLPLGARTLAEVLREKGFYTFGVYHNIYVNPAFGLHQGFEEYASLEERAGPLVDRALARLEQIRGDRRFFLYLHLFDPHNPYEPPVEECRSVAMRLAPGFANRPCVVDRRPEDPLPPRSTWPWAEALYDAEVAHVDREVGRFLRRLDEMGLADNTVVAIVSDHGEEFWGRYDDEVRRGYDANSDHGHALYEELVHVPAMIRDPGRKPAVVPGLAGMADLFPTLLTWVGVAPPASQGHDLSSLLAEPRTERPTLLADVVLHGPERWSVRRGPWKLIAPREATTAAVELYNLDRDPGERRDLAPGQAALVGQLRALGEKEIAARKAARNQFFGAGGTATTYLQWNYITKLRSLGYLR
jgi:arylsulfatase A-like enzyme